MGKLAILLYETPRIVVVQRGDHVICAVSGEKIPLDHLRYWSVARQEAYRGAREAQAAEAGEGASHPPRPSED